MTTLDAARILYGSDAMRAHREALKRERAVLRWAEREFRHKVTLRIGSRSRDFTMTTRQVNRTIARLAEGKPGRRRGWLVVDGVVAARWGRRGL